MSLMVRQALEGLSSLQPTKHALHLTASATPRVRAHRRRCWAAGRPKAQLDRQGDTLDNRQQAEVTLTCV